MTERKVVDYFVIGQPNVGLLRDSVMEKVKQGYWLHGSFFADEHRFYQAMVKYEVEDISAGAI